LIHSIIQVGRRNGRLVAGADDDRIGARRASRESATMIVVRRTHLPFFLLFSSVVLAVSFFIIRSGRFAVHPDLLSAAVTLDMVVLVPLVYLVMARRLGWRAGFAIPILVLMLIAANLLVPDDHQRMLDALELLLAPLELVLMIFLVIKVRAVRSEYRQSGADAGDFFETLEKIVGRTVDAGRLGKVITTEIAVIYYGLLAWRQQPVDRPGATSFSYHRNCGHGTIMGVFLFLIFVETGALHWYLLPRSAPLAWVVFALGIYSVVFLLADLNAARLRPIFLDGNDLVVRTALRWRVGFPLTWIARVETTTHDIEDTDGLLKAFLIPNQNVILHLDRPTTAAGLYGMEKRFRRLALAVDDLPAFVNALAAPARDAAEQTRV
jgi:hypothetical protein